MVAENGYKYTFLECDDAGIVTNSMQVAEGFVGFALNRLQCGIIGVSLFADWYELQQECYTAIQDENLDSWKETDPLAKFNKSFCGREYTRIKASLQSVLPYLDKVEQQRMVEICQKYMEWAEVECGLAVDADAPYLQGKLRTARALKYFPMAIARGWIKVLPEGLSWCMEETKGSKASLAYYLDKVYDKGNIPETALERLFGVSRISKTIYQNRGIDDGLPWKETISNIFEAP